jgi:hypothetical protein
MIPARSHGHHRTRRPGDSSRAPDEISGRSPSPQKTVTDVSTVWASTTETPVPSAYAYVGSATSTTAMETGIETRSVSARRLRGSRRGGTQIASTISGMPTVANASTEFWRGVSGNGRPTIAAPAMMRST